MVTVKYVVLALVILSAPAVYLQVILNLSRAPADQKREYPMERCNRAAKRAQMRWPQADWRVEPCAVLYHGEISSRSFWQPKAGVLGMIGNAVCFVPEYGSELVMLLDQIRFIHPETMAFYCEHDQRWHVYRFDPLSYVGVMNLLNALEALVVPVTVSRSVEAIKVHYRQQNVYGQWEPRRCATLYLAPDRLLVNWHSSIPLAEMRELAIVTPPNWTLGSRTMLRITYAPPDHAPSVIGFVMSTQDADIWASVLRERTGIVVEHFEGPKKKAG
jgi:hypothetical protein